MNSTSTVNAISAEIDKFSQSYDWWDRQGAFKTLHDINPVRLAYIASKTTIANRRILDVGCGGGLLCEALALAEGKVLGIDLNADAIDIAKWHAQESGLSIDYQNCALEQLSCDHDQAFDLISCMELLEHVPQPAKLVADCAQRVKTGGHLFFSTINRHPLAWFTTILGAEYVCALIPRNTHTYAQFIQPSELWHACQQAGLTVQDLCGLHYNPWLGIAKLDKSLKINYFLHAVKCH